MAKERKAPEGMPQNTGATLKRVIAYVMEHYKIHYAVVVVCIIFSTLVSLVGTLAMRTLIDAISGNAPSERPVAPTIGTPRQATSFAGRSFVTENPHGRVPSFAA